MEVKGWWRRLTGVGGLLNVFLQTRLLKIWLFSDSKVVIMQDKKKTRLEENI